ncbi:MAG: nuclease-related domain-containing protein, partial [Acidimicrobiales bacterium]
PPHDRYEHQMDARWGRFAGIAKLFAPEPQSTKAWAVGAAGERQAAEVLEGVLGADAALLHDRAIPGSRANIDHVAVAASGVWVIDTKHYRGRVERRDRGGWFTPDIRLVMGGRDRSADIEGTGRQLAAVAAALGDPGLPLHAALCLVGAEWSWFAKPFEVGGVHVAAPRDLARLIRRPGPLDPRQAQGLTARLAHRLPAR